MSFDFEGDSKKKTTTQADSTGKPQANHSKDELHRC